ncbi:MAG: MoxR family ATPase [Deltaproteobacteria bacterium]|nr:MoxR family ATPase [Deltaproteobacteria bacterium]
MRVHSQEVAPIADGAFRAAAQVALRIDQAVEKVIAGKQEVVRLLVTALFARGHVLIEDVPGVGKTTLARSLARAIGGTFRRIQFTADMLPSDIVGVSIYDQKNDRFDFKQGPLFANVVLADELNRTSPRTQSALMEALNEGQISVDNDTLPLPDPFFVVATQNPIEHFGAYPLPESQLDRFLLRVSVGYPDAQTERKIVAERGGYDRVGEIDPVLESEALRTAQRLVDKVAVDPALLDYSLRVVEATRQSDYLSLGISTRGAIAWYRAAQGYALADGRGYCVPDDFKTLALPVLSHRVVLASNQRADDVRNAQRVLQDILAAVPIPV